MQLDIIRKQRKEIYKTTVIDTAPVQGRIDSICGSIRTGETVTEETTETNVPWIGLGNVKAIDA